jgi:dolichol-phosphate mannosyltransferase
MNRPASEENKAGEKSNAKYVSVIIPTYNEAENIINLIEAIRESIPSDVSSEIIVVDDSSPDGTGIVIEKYKVTQGTNTDSCPVRILHRDTKYGLISAILTGIRYSVGKNILIMDADLSHPPNVIPLIIKELKRDPQCLVVASRYVEGGSIVGWPFRRKIVSNVAALIARYALKLCHVSDPVSGFFAFPRYMIDGVRFETKGYKFLLELLVKSRPDIQVIEIPYTFVNRGKGQSKFDRHIISNYVKSIWILYRYGRRSSKYSEQFGKAQKRRSILFLSKAGRFFTVGASGLLINYIISYLLSSGILSTMWYIQATTIGIMVSITSNFILNKMWTFEDFDFSTRHLLRQYFTYLGFTSLGALVQLSLLYLLVESSQIDYGLSLLLAVGIASIGNFIMNKKWTFGEKIWG